MEDGLFGGLRTATHCTGQGRLLLGKYIILDLIAESLVAIARGDRCGDTKERDTNSWFCVAEQAIFAISPKPEKVSMEILLDHQSGIFGTDGSYCIQYHCALASSFTNLLCAGPYCIEPSSLH